MIPGFLIAIVTFPGVIVHELGHKLFCQVTKTKVLEVCYFRLGNPAGYVSHEPPATVWKHILIGVGPFIVNTSIGFFIGLFATRSIFNTGNMMIAGIVMGWLGVSIAMHSFPSKDDAKAIWRAIWSKGVPALPRLVGTPLVIVIFIGVIGSIFWVDFLYGLAVSWYVPKLVLEKIITLACN